MDNTERYLNFVRNYNEKLKEKGTIWLGPKDMGAVLLQTAAENQQKEREEHGQNLREGDAGFHDPFRNADP